MSELVACEDGRPNAALARLQSIQKAILAEVSAFCAEHDIPFVLAAGSALGAARHGDMIPWDDDIDIAMMRDDLRRFEMLWLNHYEGQLSLHSPRTERAYPLDFVKIRVPGTAMNEPELDASGMVDGIYLDIFALDVLPRSATVRTAQKAGLALLNLVIMSFSPHTTTVGRSRLVRALRRVALALRPVLPWRALLPIRDRLSALGTKRGGVDLVCFEMYGLGHSQRTVIAADAVFPPTRGSFGDLAVPLPRDTEVYLVGLFGDWRTLPPPDRRQPPHARHVDFGGFQA